MTNTVRRHRWATSPVVGNWHSFGAHWHGHCVAWGKGCFFGAWIRYSIGMKGDLKK